MKKSDAIKLLAIDDKPDNLTTLSAVVRDALSETLVLTATNVRAGMELAAAEDPDVILLDMGMPGMDGFKVCRRLKADDRIKDIPVLFLTALKPVPAGLVEALEAGAEGFLAKPLEAAELIAQIRAMAKINTANRRQRTEKDRLEALVAERTRELTDEAARWRLLMENSRDGMVILDQDGQVYESNRKFAEMLGYPHDSMGKLNVRDWEFMHPPEHVMEMVSSADAKGDHFETKHRRRDGSL
jgi:DNA-binding response OmpR family regulator